MGANARMLPPVSHDEVFWRQDVSTGSSTAPVLSLPSRATRRVRSRCTHRNPLPMVLRTRRPSLPANAGRHDKVVLVAEHVVLLGSADVDYEAHLAGLAAVLQMVARPAPARIAIEPSFETLPSSFWMSRVRGWTRAPSTWCSKPWIA